MSTQEVDKIEDAAEAAEICPHCGAHLVSHQDYCDHLSQKNCPAANSGGARVYPDWRESPDGPYD